MALEAKYSDRHNKKHRGRKPTEDSYDTGGFDQIRSQSEEYSRPSSKGGYLTQHPHNNQDVNLNIGYNFEAGDANNPSQLSERFFVYERVLKAKKTYPFKHFKKGSSQKISDQLNLDQARGRRVILRSSKYGAEKLLARKEKIRNKAKFLVKKAYIDKQTGDVKIEPVPFQTKFRSKGVSQLDKSFSLELSQETYRPHSCQNFRDKNKRRWISDKDFKLF